MAFISSITFFIYISVRSDQFLRVLITFIDSDQKNFTSLISSSLTSSTTDANERVNGRQMFMLKKADAPQWEDLGWAWGKRKRSAQSEAPFPASANWDDLGWAWGKRSEVGQQPDRLRGGESGAGDEAPFVVGGGEGGG